MIAQQTVAVPSGKRTVTVTRTHDRYTPKEAFFYISLLQSPHAVGVTLNGAAVPDLTGGGDATSAAALAASPGNAFYFSTSLQTIFIKVFDNATVLAATADF